MQTKWFFAPVFLEKTLCWSFSSQFSYTNIFSVTNFSEAFNAINIQPIWNGWIGLMKKGYAEIPIRIKNESYEGRRKDMENFQYSTAYFQFVIQAFEYHQLFLECVLWRPFKSFFEVELCETVWKANQNLCKKH